MSIPVSKVYEVVIVGGGAAGISVAAMLKRKNPGAEVLLIEPSEFHYYQPAWTLVGAGAFSSEKTRRETVKCIPAGVTWLKAKVVRFSPEQNQLALEDGSSLSYRFLVVAAGLKLNWHQIEGLEETLGQNGVTSNYRFDLAPYTWQCVQAYSGRGPALFTQPAMPIKCAGAPQKAMYLSADRMRQRSQQAEIHFFTPGGAMFGVPFYAQALDKVVVEYGIQANFSHNLVAVDGPRRQAVFDVVKNGVRERKTMPFEFLHVVPPQSAPDFIAKSPLADSAGWVAVDKGSLSHTTFNNVFGLGDCTSTPNSKTAAAVKNQVPVLVSNLLAAMQGKGPSHTYDGYASCPLTTSVGKIMLAEFCYDGVVTPSFPLDPRVPRRAYWHLKKDFLPWLYWDILLKGKDWPVTHKVRHFKPQVPTLTA